MAVGDLSEGNVGLPIGHMVRQLGGYADMQACGYAARRYTVIGYLALWLAPIGHLAVGCCFHILFHSA